MRPRKTANEKKQAKRLKLSTAIFKGGYVHNSVLTQLTGVCTIAAAATSFKNAIWLSLSFLILIFVCEIIASAFLKGVSRWVRICAYCVISAAALIPIYSRLDEPTAASLGVYLPLLCVSGIIVVRCEKFSVRTTVRNSALDAVATAVGYSAVAVIVGIIREYIASGTVFGMKLGQLPRVSAMAMPFGGLIVLGFLAALQKWSVKKYFPREITDTFSFSGAFEKPLLKDPGLNSKDERKKAKEQEKEKLEYDRIKPRYSIEDVESAFGEEEDES